MGDWLTRRGHRWSGRYLDDSGLTSPSKPWLAHHSLTYGRVLTPGLDCLTFSLAGSLCLITDADSFGVSVLRLVPISHFVSLYKRAICKHSRPPAEPFTLLDVTFWCRRRRGRWGTSRRCLRRPRARCTGSGRTRSCPGRCTSGHRPTRTTTSLWSSCSCRLRNLRGTYTPRSGILHDLCEKEKQKHWSVQGTCYTAVSKHSRHILTPPRCTSHFLL